MKRRTRVVLSLFSGIAAAAIAFVYASSLRVDADRARNEAMARYGGDLVAVCVATRDIDPGEALDEGNVAVEEWVASLVPAGSATSLKEAVGRTATSRIPKRAVICATYFKAGTDEIEVPRGKVAVSIASDAEHAVGGALARGDTVDVYVSKDGVADRLAQAQVLDTSALADGGGEVSWVTLAVGQGTVGELLAARERGAVTLVIPGIPAKSADGEAEQR